MTQEQNAKLLQAYRAAIEEGQHEIADMLEDVLLSELRDRLFSNVICDGKTTTEPSWRITCGPDVVPLSATMECTGIDHLSKEATE